LLLLKPNRFTNRRFFLKKAVITSSIGLLASKMANAEWLTNLFSISSIEESFAHSFETKDISLSDKINLKIPTIAENGAVVPLTVTCSLENVEQIYIFVEKNPVPLVAVFNLSPDIDAFVSARVKMAKTSQVTVIVKAESRLYKTQKLVKVTIGGCGG
jgi:sulfur-oxidizing protein SoxY